MTLWTEFEFANMGDIKSDCCLKNIEKPNAERKVMQFLKKLRSDYEVRRGNILNRGTTPDILRSQ